MTLSEAEKQIEFQSNLIGKRFREKTIDGFVIIPVNGDNLGKIVGLFLRNKHYEHFLAGHDDFKVIVLLGIEEYQESGNLDFEEIEKVLKSRAK